MVEEPTHIEHNFDNADSFYDFLSDFDREINEHNNDATRHNLPKDIQTDWMFRGHWDSTWSLIPAAFRKGWYKGFLLQTDKKVSGTPTIKKPKIINLNDIKSGQIKTNKKFKHQIMIECALLEHFMTISASRNIPYDPVPLFSKYRDDLQEASETNNYGKLKRWPKPSIWSLMTLAQHHGMPTRFLDFTYDPFIAAFFAATQPFFDEHIKKKRKSKRDKSLCVWIINKETADKKSWKEVLKTSDETPNIVAQSGVLIRDVKANKHFLTHKKWRDLEDIKKPNRLIKITLPQKKCKELLWLLWDKDMTPARIKPNLDNVTQTLEYVHWLWKKNN